MNQNLRQTRVQSILRHRRVNHVPDAELSAVFHQKSSRIYSHTCQELGALAWTDLDEHALCEDFTIFANMIALIARRHSTRTGVMVEIGALHRKGRPDTTKIEVVWGRMADDPEDFEELQDAGYSISMDEIAIELPLPPELTRRLWARFALDMGYVCENSAGLIVYIPHIEVPRGACPE